MEKHDPNDVFNILIKIHNHLSINIISICELFIDEKVLKEKPIENKEYSNNCVLINNSSKPILIEENDDDSDEQMSYSSTESTNDSSYEESYEEPIIVSSIKISEDSNNDFNYDIIDINISKNIYLREIAHFVKKYDNSSTTGFYNCLDQKNRVKFVSHYSKLLNLENKLDLIELSLQFLNWVIFYETLPRIYNIIGRKIDDMICYKLKVIDKINIYKNNCIPEPTYERIFHSLDNNDKLTIYNYFINNIKK